MSICSVRILNILEVIAKFLNPVYSVDNDADKSEVLTPLARFVVNTQRLAAIFIGLGGAAFLMLKPSRNVQAIYLAKLPKKSPGVTLQQNVMIVQCGRLFGSVPTYYVFDGREEERIKGSF